MKKHFLILFSALIISSATLVRADDVSIKNAEKVAISFFYEKANQFKTVDYNDINITNSFIEKRNNESVYYIFNINNDGFVIVSAEDASYPVLAYSFETLHYTQNNSPEFEYWMDNYARQITDMKAKNLKADIEAEKTWSHLLTSSPTELKTAKSKSIAPFITTTWGQGKYYNKFTPYDPQAMDDNHCPTGCVATSMAVVMNYYRYPVNGFASKTYNANNAQWGYGDYGYLSADFENTTYDYDQMLPTYDGNSGESCTQVSRLMYHAGVSVSMMYGPDGSGTGMNDAFQALKVYWKFSTSIQIKERAGTIPSQWLSYLTTNLDDKKPIIYAGRDNSPGGGGHAWICDGYQGTDYFHFDWGWEGSDNGYYYINNLNTSNGNYTDDQEALFNIYPKNSYPTHCTGQKDIIGTSGTIVDGSGKFDYQDNNDCTWLIKPPSNDSIENITLKWHAFYTESGQDIVTIYDGSSISDPVLGTYSGNSIPPEVTSTGTEMLVRFVTNSSNGHPGWLATYSTSGPHYCNFMSLTDVSGTIEDGSGAKNYRNKTSCLYFIQPPGATTIDFTLTKFDTEEGYDYLTITDPASGTLLAKLTGTYLVDSLPPTITSPSGRLQLLFQSDYSGTASGWTATWQETSAIEENEIFRDISVYPNPAENILNINFNLQQTQALNISLVSVTGKVVFNEEVGNFVGDFKKTIDLLTFTRGIYFLQLISEQGILNRKIVLQ